MSPYDEDKRTRKEFEEAARKALREGELVIFRVRVPYKVALHSKCGCPKPMMVNMGWHSTGGPRVEEGFFVAILNDANQLVHELCGRSLY